MWYLKDWVGLKEQLPPMLVTILDAKVWLEKQGLHVACSGDHSLWIAAAVSDFGDGVKLSNDACSLFWNSDRWVAVFPADGMLTYEVPGNLDELTSLLVAVYHQHRRTGTSLSDVFRQVVDDSEQSLVGRSLSRI